MDYPKPIKRPGTKVLYFFYTHPITGKRHQKSTGETGARKARKVIEQFIDELYGVSADKVPRLLEYLDLFGSIETNPKYREAQITNFRYGTAHARNTAATMGKLKSLLQETSYLHRNLDRFTPLDIKQIAQMIVEAYGQTRGAQIMFQQFKMLFNFAADNHILPYSPAAKIRDIAYKTKPRKPISIKAVRTIIDRRDLHQSDQAADFIALAALTGMRRGELLALSGSHISGSRLLVSQAMNDYDKSIGTTKTGNSRLLPLSTLAQQILRPYADQEITFQNNNGDYLTQKTVSRWFAFFRENAIADEDIPLNIKEEISQSSLHVLRHSLATHLRFAGVHDALIKTYFGWSLHEDQDMLERYSGKDGYLQECADMIDSLFSGKIVEMPEAKKA